jgi:hypothetical protein
MTTTDLQGLLERSVAPVRIPLGPDLEMRVSAAVGDDGRPAVDAALWRCSPDDRSREFHRTAAGWRIPAHLAPLAAEGLIRLAKRTSEAWAFAPVDAAEGGRG